MHNADPLGSTSRVWDVIAVGRPNTAIQLHKRLCQMHRLAVWDNKGREYLPLYGYDWQIEAYAPAKEAIDIFWTVWYQENGPLT